LERRGRESVDIPSRYFPGSIEDNHKIISKAAPKAHLWHLYVHAFQMFISPNPSTQQCPNPECNNSKTTIIVTLTTCYVNPLNTELNPICQ